MERIEKLPMYAVDLFAGCGGLSEGFKQSGFEVIAHVEMDKWACKTLRTRSLYYFLKRTRRNIIYNKYLKNQITIDDILDRYPEAKDLVNLQVIESELGDDGISDIVTRIKDSMKYHDISKVNVLLGGPPCQPYSLIGRSRDSSRMQNDNRHYLYRYYLKILEALQPDFFVYENVPGLFSAKAGGVEIFRRILHDFHSLHPAYEITPPLEKIVNKPHSYLLNSVDLGVPQNRKRLILVGYRKSLEDKDQQIQCIFSRLQKLATSRRNMETITVEDAISDLPFILPGQGSDGWYSGYSRIASNRYQKKMRTGSPGVINHRARHHMQGDIERYRFFIEQLRKGKGAANLIDLINERPDLIPNHKQLYKFIDRFKVQWWNKPASTITAHISKDGHYYIHPDIYQSRSFTVREAARCQSFPDNYKFEGPRTEQFKQVGNAVPPLLASFIGKSIYKELEYLYG